MKITFLFLVLCSVAIAKTDPKRVCDEGAVESRLLKDWKKNKKDRYCLEVECKLKDKTMQREKCFFESGSPNVIFVSTSDLYPGSLKSRADKVFLNSEEKCTDACMDGMKKSCLACFKERALEYKEEEFINYPEIGKPIRRGTKCFYACQDKEGPIQKTRVLSQECISCVGVNGATAEKFEYLQTKLGACFELDSQRRLFRVEPTLCKEAGDKLHQTTYRSSQSFSQWLFNANAGCFEVDELTMGSIVKIETDGTHCGSGTEVNNSDRNLIKEEKPKQKTQSGPTSSKQ